MRVAQRRVEDGRVLVRQCVVEDADDGRIGYFIRCSGSILSNTWAAVDKTSAFELPGNSSALTSPFYHSLREIFTIYAIIQFACTRNGGAERLPPGERPRPAFDLDLTGPEWTEPWFGVSRRTFVLLADVSGIVYQRQAVLRAQLDGSALDLILRAEAERLAAELGDVSVWSEAAIEPGLSDRVQRGSAVRERLVRCELTPQLMRHALRTMLLCEVLETPLSDARLAAARARAMELAADCEPSNMVGLQWALTVSTTLYIGLTPDHRSVYPRPWRTRPPPRAQQDVPHDELWPELSEHGRHPRAVLGGDGPRRRVRARHCAVARGYERSGSELVHVEGLVVLLFLRLCCTFLSRCTAVAYRARHVRPQVAGGQWATSM